MGKPAAVKKKPKLKFEPYPEAEWGNAWYCVGDVHEQLAKQADGSVDLVMTSPPFLALRSYLPDDHPDKAHEIGQEGTPGAFLDAMLDVVEELGRVLAPHGSIVIELGDTYSGSGGAGGDYNAGGMRDGAAKFSGSESKRRDARHTRGGDFEASRLRAAGKRDGKFSPDWPAAKCKTLIPELFAVALAYGFNPLTGRETEPWLVRNIVAWCRPNPPVGALGDKFRPATSYLTIATKNPKRYFDLDAVRIFNPRVDEKPTGEKRESARVEVGLSSGSTLGEGQTQNPAGAPPLDWWEVPTQPYKGSHYAVMPEAICVRPVLSMAPERVCVTCGVPSRRITERTGSLDESRAQSLRAMELAEAGGLTEEHFAAIRSFGISDAGKAMVTQSGAGQNSERVKALAAEAKAVLGGYFREFLIETPATVGWTDCGHNDWRRGLVLDPFAGSGTTLKVATMVGRDALGFDLDARNAALAADRVPEGHLFVEGGAEPTMSETWDASPHLVETAAEAFKATTAVDVREVNDDVRAAPRGLLGIAPTHSG